jgi:hypothetical protein
MELEIVGVEGFAKSRKIEDDQVYGFGESKEASARDPATCLIITPSGQQVTILILKRRSPFLNN